MSRRLVLCLLSLTLLLTLSSVAYAGERQAVIEKVRLLESRPIMDVLQAAHISAEERTTAYIYQDRIEYYDNQLLGQLQKIAKLPATAENGVLFTEVFFTQFRKSPGLYVVQRGWDKDGNCHVLTSRVRTGSAFKDEGDVEIEIGNSCSGDPCRKCKPYDPQNGCICELGEKCNHTVSN